MAVEVSGVRLRARRSHAVGQHTLCAHATSRAIGVRWSGLGQKSGAVLTESSFPKHPTITATFGASGGPRPTSRKVEVEGQAQDGSYTTAILSPKMSAAISGLTSREAGGRLVGRLVFLAFLAAASIHLALD